MSVCSILLRVLLALSLVLNGSGYAVASVHMQMDQAGQASTNITSVGNPSEAAEPPCAAHHASMGSMSAKAQVGDTAADVTSVESGHPFPDCCESGACRCACVHQCQAAVFAVTLQLAVIEKVSNTRPMAPGHESPAVPHLIRPPIV